MLEASRNKDEIIVKQKHNLIFIAIGIILVGIAAFCVWIVVSLLPFETAYTFVDVLSVVFVSVFILTVLGLGAYVIVTNSKRVIINNDGVLCKSLVGMHHIKWSDIKDWGISYCGQTRGEGNTYYLYFSDHQCQAKDDCRKKLKGKMIKAFVFEREYFEAVSRIVPFCKKRVTVEPFIGTDKYHLIF
ncbi:MAG: hypothetical protein E7627_05225 [Ruminococcaceae bacterium]|nr:hypothetical protein [Oscillospiraceae bacterium]